MLKNRLDEVLYGDEGKYAYLFPNRTRLPEIKRHPFEVVHRQARVDQFVVKTMLEPMYIGWTAKVILGIDLFPMQMAILQELWNKPFPMLVASRGAGKSYILAVYCILRALLEPGVKIVIVGAGLRQAKLVFGYIEDIWKGAPVLRSIVGGGKKAGPKQSVDLCHFDIGESKVYALPLGDGSKIRGFRANIVIADEFASIPEEIFDVVVRGFTATAKSPVEMARNAAIEKRLRQEGYPENQIRLLTGRMKGNQIIYSGTAYYAFNHFAKRFAMWCQIVRSKGRMDRVADIFGGENNVPENFDYRDYAVIRLPYTHVQEGLLDQRQLAHAKAVLPRNIFLMEYGAVFVKDSDGFYPRSLIEACIASESQPIQTRDGLVWFDVQMRGEEGRKYVIGIDPAAERDNLAITVVEVWQNHYRVVFCWAVNKPEFAKRKRRGLVTDTDYYAYCCSKIRQVIRDFGPVRVEMDAQGGGLAIAEMLRNKKLVGPNETPIYEVIDPQEPKETDGETDGPHILHLVVQNTEWNSQSNVFLHKSFETKKLLFPGVNTVKLQAAYAREAEQGVRFDTYEDAVNNLEELKNEICTIQISQTATGKERFDTVNVTQPGAVEGRKRMGRLRKDRYTSLLLAHRYIYDNETAPAVGIDYNDVAGNIRAVKADPSEGLYRGPGVSRLRNGAEWREVGLASTGAVKRGERF